MALSSFNGTQVGVSGVSVPGISVVTQVSDGQEYGQISRAKDSDGELKSIFMSKGTYTSEVTGYTSAIAAPALGQSITGVGGTQKVMQSQLQASNQDFAKVTVTGKGL
jgi:uncharacterized protein YlxW (UPF0749 family)